MKRHDRLKEIETVWKRYNRHEYFDGNIPWDQIQWEPFAIKGRSQERAEMCKWEDIVKNGLYFYIWGECEEASGWIEWDWVLLNGLYTWYSLPEDCNAPFFLNEVAMAFCIPDVRWADNAVLLFQNPDSVLLGMEQMDAEKEEQEAALKARLAEMGPGWHPASGGSPKPVDKTQALAFLSK